MKKNILITGVSTGIGRTCVQFLTRKGFHVFGSVRKIKDADSLKAECGDLFTPLVFDVQDTNGIYSAVKLVQNRLGENDKLHGLVNNAGIAVGGPLLLLSMDDFRKQFEVNIHGLLQVTRSFLPLLKGGESDAQGRIINIGSVSGKRAIPFTGPYVASKHALEGLTDTLRMELMIHGIDVILIEPGPVQSAIWEKTPDPDDNPYIGTEYEPALRKFYTMLMERKDSGMPAEVIARLVFHVFECRKPRTRYLVTRNKFRNYFLPRILPDRWVDRVVSKYLGLTRK